MLRYFARGYDGRESIAKIADRASLKASQKAFCLCKRGH